MRWGRKIGKPVQFIEYLASGAITNDADKGVWDVTFMPVDAERAKRVSFGAAYHVLNSTYLVTAKAPVQTVADANKRRSADRHRRRHGDIACGNGIIEAATFVTIGGVDEGVALLKDSKADAIALSRESLSGLVDKLPELAHSRWRLPEFLHRCRSAEWQSRKRWLISQPLLRK